MDGPIEKRRLGKTDLQVSVLGFGGSEIGYQGCSLRTVEKLLGAALDAGLNVIDTAACYADSEQLIGNAVSGQRDRFHILTKCGHAGEIDLPDWHPELVEQSVERSLRRLRTDRLDLIQLHSCGEDLLRQGELIAALQRVQAAGKVRYIGYSGDGGAAKYAIDCGAFDALQTSVNIADQEAIDLLLPAAVRSGIGVIAKRPIANAVWCHSSPPADSYVRPYWDRLKLLNFDFLKKDFSASIGTALRFTLTAPGVHTAIVGTTKPGRWQENAKLLSAGPLPSSEFEKIRARWREVTKSDWFGQQ